jgi:hypothetical protein
VPAKAKTEQPGEVVTAAPGEATPEFFDRLTGRSQRAANWKMLVAIVAVAAVIAFAVAMNAGR